MQDLHAHMVPPVYYEALKDHGALLEDGFPVPAWSADEHLKFMDAANISWSLLSVSSPHPYFGDKEESRQLCRQINLYGAELKNKYPERFGFAATLPLPDVEGAVSEAVYALDVLKADAVKLASNSRGLYLGEPCMEPLFEELDKRKCTVIIHPHRPEPLKEGIFTAGPVPLFEFLCDTTRAVLNLIASGATARHPYIRFIVPHCGSFLPNIYDRLKGICRILVPQGLMSDIDTEAEFAKLYFDTAGNPLPDLFPLLETKAAPGHILYGSDYPFTPKEQVLENLKALREYKGGAALSGSDFAF